ncbi:hypothetical protein C8Q74DRAFT_841071 [Fomes fomentarius]|nr:hypothetical protein C8Q74DRAFT_841071 [Fomes fomentarius]
MGYRRLISDLATPSFLQTTFFLILSARLVAATTKTVTIDDTYGDEVTGVRPVYSPSASWSQGRRCVHDEECLVNPDPNEVGRGTWHDAVGMSEDAPSRTIALSFEGNSISIYCIISQADRVEIAVANMTFELDGAPVGDYFHEPDGAMDAAGNYLVKYDVDVFQSGSIPQGNHTLRVSSVGYSRMLFDYAQYTTEDETDVSAPPSRSGVPTEYSNKTYSSSRSPLALILGMVGGAVTLLVIGLLALFLIRRRRRRSAESETRDIDDLKYERHFHGNDEIDSRSFISFTESTESLAPERPPTPFFPFMNANVSPSKTKLLPPEDHSQQSLAASPTDSIPIMDFPAPPSRVGYNIPRIVVTSEETRLVGPDNSMTLFARKQIAERETELTHHMGEMEAALAAKYSASAPPSSPSVSPNRRGTGEDSAAALVRSCIVQ